MLPSIVEVQVHLACVSVAELADFQINDEQTPQTPMEENEINPESCVVQTQTALADKEGGVIAKFQEEVREMLDESFFEF